MPTTAPTKKKKSPVQKWMREAAALQGVLEPGEASPICRQCKLCDTGGAASPYLPYAGADDPWITFVVERVTKEEDKKGAMSVFSGFGDLQNAVKRMAEKEQFPLDKIRWTSSTRCAVRTSKKVAYKTPGGYCRIFLKQDLDKHRPRVIVPVGSTALGLLCHKSNAEVWMGKTLTYRGWPDEWLIKKAYREGHPIFGSPPGPESYIPMVPVQAPYILYAQQNVQLFNPWIKAVRRAMRIARDGAQVLQYDRPWFELTDDPDRIVEVLSSVPDKTLLTYDTETEGLLPYAGQKIVFMMFRWEQDGAPRSIGFPWDFGPVEGVHEGSKVRAHIPRLSPVILDTLYRSRIIGHNLTFDILFTAASLPGADLDRLCDAMWADTLHELYCYRQQRGSFGLERVTYEWCPDMAGYEEAMVLLIEQEPELLHPAKGGHYANCPPDKWESHLKPYVMGDVETVHHVHRNVRAALDKTESFKIPMASPSKPGQFRWFKAPNRAWVYSHLLRPAARVLCKMMGRGMHVDLDELSSQEQLFPDQIKAARSKLREGDERIVRWCEQMEATERKKDGSAWELDLEDRKQLKTILFELLELPIKRLTKAGRQTLGEEVEEVIKKFGRAEVLKYAAADKFTLNLLAVDHPEIRPLQEYRKIYKLYTGFIRPLRNCRAEGIDKKDRTKDQHLMLDDRVHTSFLLSGTRGGRLSSRNPNLQNLPKDGIVKSIFVSRFGQRGCIYQGDLSQIELRLLAAACGDPSMVKAYRDGLDLHALTQSKIYRRSYEECTKQHMEKLQAKGKSDEAKKLDFERRLAKIANFLTGYGGGALGLQSVLAASGVYLALEECQDIIERFFEAYPSLKNHIGYYKSFIQEAGCAVSIFGRVRWLEEVHSDDRQIAAKGLRSGYNHLIQSTASDMMLISLCLIEARMRAAGLESILISTVHDSLVVDAVRSELPQVHEIVTGVIEDIPAALKEFFGEDYNTSWCIVPFGGDYEVGLNYLDSKKIPKEPDWDKLLRED